MLAAAGILRDRIPGLQFVLPVAPTLTREFVESFVRKGPVPVTLTEGGVYDALRASDAALVASGTATLEAGLMAVPMVIVYRVSPLSYAIGKLFVDVEHIGLVNIVAGERVVPELVQRDATPENMTDALTKLLNDSAYYGRVQARLADIRTKLGESGTNARVAALVREFLGEEGPKQ
jgi:lipid-A-disaccharide synthase